MLFCGFRQKPTTRPLAPRAWKTRRHGGRSTCVGRWAQKFTTSPGRRMQHISSLAAWTTSRGYTTLAQVGRQSRHLPSEVPRLMRLFRNLGQTDCRAQSLRPRRDLGSAKRVHRNTVIGSLRTYLFSEDQGRSLHVRQPQ